MTLEPSSLLALFGIMLLLSATPGPSDVAVVSRALTSGFRIASFMVYGILLADLLFILFAILGLSALYNTLGDSFGGIQWLCAIYLCWLGVGQWRAGGELQPKPVSSGAAWSSFQAGLLITLSDPKAILFYMGLFPAFVDMQQVTPADGLAVLLLATVVIIAVKFTYAFLGDRAARFFRNHRARHWLNRASGMALIGIGLLIIWNIGIL